VSYFRVLRLGMSSYGRSSNSAVRGKSFFLDVLPMYSVSLISALAFDVGFYATTSMFISEAAL
jgi:hypothetical protein